MRIALLGAAFSAGGAHPGCRHAPEAFREREYPQWRRRLARQQLTLSMHWAGIVREENPIPLPMHCPQARRALLRNNQRLMRNTCRLRRGGMLPVVIGGDHSCAIGTWTGIAAAHRQPIGLLWIDAHLDAHTPETSASMRLHGMPLAVLLGEGDPDLASMGGLKPVIDPRYCAVIGVRSYEEEEPLTLARLGVRFHTREEILRRGLPAVVAEAWRQVASAPGGFGVSLDLDVLDPMLAPGVSVPEQGGLRPDKLASILCRQPLKQRLRGLEIVELNPRRDPQGQTLRLLPRLMTSLLLRR
jgi:arginase